MTSAPIPHPSSDRPIHKMSILELFIRLAVGIPVALVCFLLAVTGVWIAALIPGLHARRYYDAVMEPPEKIFSADRI